MATYQGIENVTGKLISKLECFVRLRLRQDWLYYIEKANAKIDYSDYVKFKSLKKEWQLSKVIRLYSLQGVYIKLERKDIYKTKPTSIILKDSGKVDEQVRKFISDALKNYNYPQKAICNFAGINPSNLSKYKKGNTNFKLTKLLCLFDALDIAVYVVKLHFEDKNKFSRSEKVKFFSQDVEAYIRAKKQKKHTQSYMFSS